MGNLKSYHYAIIFINIFIIVYMYILLAVKYKDLPDEVPSHFNFKGEIDSYSGKGILFLLPIVSTFVTLLFIGLSLIPERFWKLNIGLESVELSPEVRSSVINLSVTDFTVLSLFITAFLAFTFYCMIYAKQMSILIIVIFIIGVFLINILYLVLLFIKLKPILLS